MRTVLYMCIVITSFTDKQTDESKQDNNSTDSTERRAPVIYLTCSLLLIVLINVLFYRHF